MSSKSTGSHLLVPDRPVKEYSAKLNSNYELLHQAYSQLILLPEELHGYEVIFKRCESLFYSIRDLLEDDFGIHPYTARILLVDPCGALLKYLYRLEENHEEAKSQYLRRLKEGENKPKYAGEYTSFWRDVRLTVFGVDRCLSITRERVANCPRPYPTGDHPPQYSWVGR